MKVKLERDRENIFFISNDNIYKNKIRIMCIYENTTILGQDEYKMIGPRKIKMLRKVDPTSKIYAKVSELKTGNRLMGR